MAELAAGEAATAEARAAERADRAGGRAMGRAMDVTDIRELLYRNHEHPRWDEVADRCLTCGNCTMVCPTCFCTTVEETTDLTGEHVERISAGTRASRWTTRACTAAACAGRRARATASG